MRLLPQPALAVGAQEEELGGESGGTDLKRECQPLHSGQPSQLGNHEQEKEDLLLNIPAAQKYL